MKVKGFLAMLAIAFAAASCGDDDSPEKIIHTGDMTVDASNYAMWTYINLKTGEKKELRDFSQWNYLASGQVVETKEAQGSEADINMEWHIAIHRFDIRTNGGEAIATAQTALEEVTAIPTGGYQADESKENTVITDMAGMMQGKIGYAATAKMNPVLCGWLTRKPTGTMPPYTYELTNLVYVVKCKDGSHAKVKFTDYQSAEGATGHVTFVYEFIEK